MVYATYGIGASSIRVTAFASMYVRHVLGYGTIKLEEKELRNGLWSAPPCPGVSTAALSVCGNMNIHIYLWKPRFARYASAHTR